MKYFTMKYKKMKKQNTITLDQKTDDKNRDKTNFPRIQHLLHFFLEKMFQMTLSHFMMKSKNKKTKR